MINRRISKSRRRLQEEGMQKGSQQLGQSMLETRFREMDYDLHVKKVTEIVESKRTRITNTVSAELKESYMNAKSGNIKFNEHVK